MNIAIRPAITEDIKYISKIEQQVSPSPWSEKMFIDSFLAGFSIYVLVREQEIVGFGLTSIAVDECQILNLAIAPRWQNQGLGRKLLTYMLNEAYQTYYANRCFLEVRASGKIAQKLYRHLGFSEVSVRPNYYQTATSREDAIVMAVDLKLQHFKDPSNFTG